MSGLRNDTLSFTEIKEASLNNQINAKYYDNNGYFTKKLSDAFNNKYSYIGFAFKKLAGNGTYLIFSQLIINGKESTDGMNIPVPTNTTPPSQYPPNSYISNSYETLTVPNEFLNGNTYYKQIISVNSENSNKAGDYIIYYSTSSKGTNGYPSLLFNYNNTYPNEIEGAFIGNNNYDKNTGNAHALNYIDPSYKGDWVFIKLPNSKSIILTSYILQFTSKNIQNAPLKWRVYGTNNGKDFTQIIDVDLTNTSLINTD